MTIIVQQIGGQWRRATGVQEIEGARLDLGKVARLVADGIWSDDELSAYGLRVAVPFVAPDGEQAVGQPNYDDVGGDIVETYETAPILPPPPEPTPEEKLAASGLTVADLKQLLGLNND